MLTLPDILFIHVFFTDSSYCFCTIDFKVEIRMWYLTAACYGTLSIFVRLNFCLLASLPLGKRSSSADLTLASFLHLHRICRRPWKMSWSLRTTLAALLYWEVDSNCCPYRDWGCLNWRCGSCYFGGLRDYLRLRFHQRPITRTSSTRLSCLIQLHQSGTWKACLPSELRDLHLLPCEVQERCLATLKTSGSLSVRRVALVFLSAFYFPALFVFLPFSDPFKRNWGRLWHLKRSVLTGSSDHLRW